MNANPTPEGQGRFFARVNEWLASRRGRFTLLFIIACLSLPAEFAIWPDVGLDPSWRLSLQLAVLQHRVFGTDFVFTYGPLGWLMIHAGVSKIGLLGYDAFLLASVLCLYREWLLTRARLLDAVALVALAVTIKASLITPAPLFTVLCYWLWRIYDRGDLASVVFALGAALLLFFGKVNYGMIMVLLVPAYGVGLLLLRRERIIQGVACVAGFPLLVWVGACVWRVDLPAYLCSGAELIAGYNEAMVIDPPRTPLVFYLACVFLLAMVVAAIIGSRRRSWKDQAMFLPLIGLAALLLFKNAFVRSDFWHNVTFFESLPLVLAVWWVCTRGQTTVYALLIASLLYPVFSSPPPILKPRAGLTQMLPIYYFRQAFALPWFQDADYLEQSLRYVYPGDILPPGVQAELGSASVDVMPWESSIAVLNGLNYRPRPVPQSYSAYTPWLDGLNARFLDSTNAPDFVLYTYGPGVAVDQRPAIWDESLTKRSLLENYIYDSRFTLPMRVAPPNPLRPGDVYLLRRRPGWRRLVPVATNQVTLAIDQPLPIPATTNLIFLTLDVKRSLAGKLKGAALAPDILSITFNYEGGLAEKYRAVLPILQTGVLVNRRIESNEETRNWLAGDWAKNIPVTAVSFVTDRPWAFRPPFRGTLVEYRVEGL